MSFEEMNARATEMTLIRLQEEQKKTHKIRQIQKENLEKAKAAGFSTVNEFIKAQKANQIHLQPLPIPEVPPSTFSSADQVFKMLSGKKTINPKLRKLSRLD